MKILFIAHEFPPYKGGMQTYAYELAKETSTKNDVSVICKKECKNLSIKNITLYSVLGENKSNDFNKDIKNCLKIIKNEKPDVVHILNSGFSSFSIYLKKELNIPVIITAHSKDFLWPWIFPRVNEKKIKQLIIDGMNNADCIIAVSNYAKEKLIEIGVQNDIFVIFNGCNPNKFYPKEKKKKILEKLNIKENERILLTVSRIMERKGQDVVIKSLPLVLKKFPKIKYLIIGRQVVGNEKKKLKWLIRKLKLKDNVIFLDYIKDKELIDYYNLSDVFVLTTKEIRVDNFLDVEGFGIVYLEAACCGKPVIASKSGGTPDAVINGKTGILVEPENVEETAEAIIRLLEDVNLAKQLGKNGRKRVTKYLNWKNISEKVLELYKRVIKKCDKKIDNIKKEINEYKPREYWEGRLKKYFNLKGVGHILFNKVYNRYLYLLKVSALNNILNKYFLNIQDKSILDIGCGTGFFVDYYDKKNAKEIKGIDITKQSIFVLKKKYPLYQFQVNDVSNPHFYFKKTFDIVNTFDILYHIIDEKKFENAIGNISKSCKKNGYILMTDVFWKNDITPAKHVKFRSLQKYEKELSKNNVRVLDITPIYYLLNRNFHLPIFVLNRLSYIFYLIDKSLQKMRIPNGKNIKLLIGKKL